jgi:hypothetical protein
VNIIDSKKLELNPVKDAYVYDCKPDETNPNGNDKVLYQGQYKGCFDRILVEWDISQIDDNAEILRDEDVSINRLPGFNSKLKVISKWPTKEGWHIINITEIVKKWHDGYIPNYGIYCHSQDTESTCVSKFISLEGSPKKLRPNLVIEYK